MEKTYFQNDPFSFIRYYNRINSNNYLVFTTQLKSQFSRFQKSTFWLK